MISIVLATEDELSEEVGRRLLKQHGIVPSLSLRKQGYGYLKSSIHKFCKMAERQPVLLITDLDNANCPSLLQRKWMGSRKKPERFLFRVAVREVESWLLADHEGLRSFLGPRTGRLPGRPDELSDPKQCLLALAEAAPRDIRADILPAKGAVAAQGLGYNNRLASYVRTIWSPDRAAELSPSLQRATRRLSELSPSSGA